MVLPLGRNVTLYFFVAGLYLTSSMYGLLPPMLSPKKPKMAAYGRRYTSRCSIYLRRIAPRFTRVEQAEGYPTKPRLRPACGLRAPWIRLNSSAIPRGARLRHSVHRCSYGSSCNRFQRPLLAV